jgi:hypothetical protein
MQMQRLRRFAVPVLLAWLFAVGSGVVNACVVQVELGGIARMAAQDDQAAAERAHQVQAHAAGGHDHESHGGNPPCKRFCDEPSAVSQSAKHDLDSANGFWLAPAPAPTYLLVPAPSRADGAFHRRSERWRAAIPIPIAFLRLTL